MTETLSPRSPSRPAAVATTFSISATRAWICSAVAPLPSAAAIWSRLMTTAIDSFEIWYPLLVVAIRLEFSS